LKSMHPGEGSVWNTSTLIGECRVLLSSIVNPTTPLSKLLHFIVTFNQKGCLIVNSFIPPESSAVCNYGSGHLKNLDTSKTRDKRLDPIKIPNLDQIGRASCR